MRARRHGIILLDAVMAMAIVGVLAVVLSSAAGRQQRSSRRLADSRAAMRLAEQAIIELRQGHALPTVQSPNHVDAQVIAGTPPVAGLSWLRVSVEWNGQSATLIGLGRQPTPRTQPAR